MESFFASDSDSVPSREFHEHVGISDSTIIFVVELNNFRMKRYIEGQQENDPLVNPVDKRCNPWAEKSKCQIL